MYYSIAFNLGNQFKGFKNHWQIKVYNNAGEFIKNRFLDPEKFTLIMSNCKLTNSPTTAERIKSGVTKSGKKQYRERIAEIICQELDVFKRGEFTDQEITGCLELAYNPFISSHWNILNGDQLHQANVDKDNFCNLATTDNKVYIFQS